MSVPVSVPVHSPVHHNDVPRAGRAGWPSAMAGLGGRDAEAGLLAAAAARAPASTADALRELGACLLGRSPGSGHEAGVSRSRLNNDGSALQLCYSSNASSARLRLIGDPAAWVADPAARLALSRHALARAVSLCQAGALAPALEATLGHLVPREPRALEAFSAGILWLAGEGHRPGLALYVEARPYDREEGWSRAAAWLSAVLPDPGPALRWMAALPASARLASVGIEGQGPENARAKLYFRLEQPEALDRLGLAPLCRPTVSRFLRRAMGEFGLEPAGLVLCAGFALGTGALVDAKVDLCGHCLAYPAHAWSEQIAAMAQELGVVTPPVAGLLASGAAEVAFVGLGSAAQGSERLNVYLKPCAGGSPYHRAVLRGVGYLQSIQRGDGAFVDYEDVPVGPSDQWVTAYVGAALAAVGATGGVPAATQMAGRAADWLTHARTYAAGWGYNAITGPDADSTGWAVALLDALDRPVAAADRAFLAAHWVARGGGMATYREPHAWGHAHPDVTAQAFLGLSAAERARRADAVGGYLLRTRDGDGLWPAYWWARPFYATYLALDLCAVLGMPVPPPRLAVAAEAPEPGATAFDHAALVGIVHRAGSPGARLWPLAHELILWQRADGAWPGAANLRVTDPECATPWITSAGQCYPDRAATITTATAVRVLARVLAERGELGGPDATPGSEPGAGHAG